MKTTFIHFMILAVTLSFLSCNKDKKDEPYTYKDITLFAGENATIQNGESLTWESSNEAIASVTNGTVYAERVGKVTISSGSNSFKVTVKGNYDLYAMPCLSWGASMSTVESFMSDYTLYRSTSTALMYYGKNYKGAQYVDYYLYMFEDNQLTFPTVMIPSDYSSILGDYLAERYIYIKSTDDNISMISVDYDMFVLVNVEYFGRELYCLVAYSPYTSESVPAYSPTDTQQFEQIFNNKIGTSAIDIKVKSEILSNILY